MTTVLVPRPAPAPSPTDVMGYMRQEGWRLVRAGDIWCVFAREIQGEEVELDVPQRSTAGDYPRAVRELLANLEIVERRPAAQILRDILSTTVDLVRLGLKGQATEDGRASIEADVRIREAARELVLSAACASITPKPVYGKRKPEQAMKHLELARFGTSEVGSYVVTIETPIPPKLQATLQPDEDPEPPYERRVGLVMARAVAAAHSAAQESAASGSLDPFTRRVQDGVSANLCDALATLLESASAQTLSVRFSFASVRPTHEPVPRHTEISADARPILRSVATELRARSPWTDFEVEGPVQMLDSSDPSQGGVAVVLAKIDGRHRKVSVRLDPSDYQEAIRAHGERRLVRCAGELVHQGRNFELRNARDFTRIAEDEG